MKIPYIAVFSALLVAGCAHTIPYSYTSSLAASPRPAECKIRVVTTPPGSGFVEIGILDANRTQFNLFAGGTDAADFMTKVNEQVCAAGGELVVTEINSYGYYVRATVYRSE
jgi:hypothetical protein